LNGSGTALLRRLAPLAAGTVVALVATTFPIHAGLSVGAPSAVTAAEPSPSGSPAPLGTPVVPDVTSDPSAGASSSTTPDVTPAPTDTAVPSPADSATAPADPPTPVPDPTVDPSPSASADPAPAPSPEASPSADPSPSAEPSATPKPYTLTPGQQDGADTATPVPVYRLRAAANAITPMANTTSPHTNYTFGDPNCATCHASHTALSPALVKTSVQAQVCYTCHTSGGDASTDIQGAFIAAPLNNEATDSYYSHPVGDASASLHVLDENNEFQGTLNRHAVCADCHNPHDATSTRPAESTTGWTAPGNISGADTVAVANGATATAPTYTLLKPGRTVYEYQLCIKCHSSFTTLPTRSTTRPSWWALDKGIEFNPANASTHPVEARGKNQTAQMAGSLAGTSPFKAWNYAIDSTIRCASCHGDSSTVNQTASGTPKTPAADGSNATHASPNRGLLIAPYRDRTLKPAGQAYNAADFALCYLCHAEDPFINPNLQLGATNTSFTLHEYHLKEIGSRSGRGTNIDVAGNGEGLAVCAECHFRIHSTAIAYKVGDTAPVARSNNSPSLVNFAPNVVGPTGFQPTWATPNSSGSGYCALTCHGTQHNNSNTSYVTAPAAGFSASPTSGAAGGSGLVVQFTDASRYVSTSNGHWSWTFGDGGTSTLQSPSHTYLSAGTYTVTLTLSRTGTGASSSTLTRTGYITVTP
jgi:predicted CXXCH cytochrome family protein